jgi:TatD DNase family protein
VNLADSHCHLDDAQFEPDLQAVIERAIAAGVRYMLAIGTGNGPPDLEAAVRLAEQYDFIYATAGVHPNDAPKVDESTFEKLRAILRHRKVKAVGEIGLDYHWGVAPELQLPVFRKQLELAAEAKMPIVIHTRDAWADTLDVLAKDWVPSRLPCIMHCFTGNVEQARACVDLGFYLSFGGVATFPKAAEVREAASIVPADRLLIETDCPYLAPVPHRGKRNEPAFVAETLRVLAKVRQIEPEDLAGQTTANFEHLLGLSS